jgi:hypothetical protein
LRLASFLISIIISSAAFSAGPLGATGLYDDLPSFFSKRDTVRTLAFRQTECDLGGYRASLLTGAIALRAAARYEVRLDVQFPAVPSPNGTTYGIGDMLLHTTARLAGDSLDASGLFVRGDIRIPSGSTGLRPFSNASLQGDAGVEVRFTWRSLAVRGAALYSLGGEARHDADFDDDRHATVAVSAGVMLPGIVRLDVASFLVHFENGDTRNMYLLSIDRDLSPQFLLELGAAFEAASAEARVFDSSISISFTYRFPPRQPPPKADSDLP